MGSHKIYETSEPDDSDDRSVCLKIYTIYICTYYKDDIAPYSPRTILEEDYENYNSFFCLCSNIGIIVGSMIYPAW